MLKRLLVRLLFGAAQSEPAPIVHRGEREISAGTGDLGVPSSPIAKLSTADAERLLGSPVRIIR